MSVSGVLSEVIQGFNWAMHAHSLMDNAYYLVIETPDGNLQGIQQLNGVYTQRGNRQRGRVGHVFQGKSQGEKLRWEKPEGRHRSPRGRR